jgi:hypothetical protein
MVWGWCDDCHRIRTVRASLNVYSIALNGMAVGTCMECEEKQDAERINAARRSLGAGSAHRRV